MHRLKYDYTVAGLVVLSFGAGQDSTVILYKLIKDLAFRDRVLGDKNLVVVFADTGDERKVTYDHLWRVYDICVTYGIKFAHLASPETKRAHSVSGRATRHIRTQFSMPSWPSLGDQYLRNHNLAIRNNKSCTDNLKIRPIYKWLDYFCSMLLVDVSYNHVGKKHLVAYTSKFGKIDILIGFSKGEEKRINKASRPGKQKWWSSINKLYPLATDLKMTRSDCIEYLRSQESFGDCGPSMCKMCPNITKQTLLLMWYTDRVSFIGWVRHERRKLKKWGTYQMAKGKTNSTALGGKLDLIGEVRKALETYKHMSVEELRAYDYSHGHCISNAY